MDAKKQQEIFAEMEIEMMTDLYTRLTASCQKKCISPKYHEGELTKGESICLDRCVGKFMEIHDKIGKKLTEMYMQDEALMKQLQQQQQK
jgi:import inner membrane translocase subunit TIM10